MNLIPSHQTFLLQKVIANVSHCIENVNLRKTLSVFPNGCILRSEEGDILKICALHYKILFGFWCVYYMCYW